MPTRLRLGLGSQWTAAKTVTLPGPSRPHVAWFRRMRDPLLRGDRRANISVVPEQQPTPEPPPAALGPMCVDRGSCRVAFVFDIGQSIDLDHAERLITTFTQRELIRHRRRAPQSFQFSPAPLRMSQEHAALRVGEFCTGPAVDSVLYDFGAVTVIFSIAIDGSFERLQQLSNDLYDNAELTAAARVVVERLAASIRPAVAKPEVAAFSEDYAIYEISSLSPACDVHGLIAARRVQIAQILRSETQPLSEQEISDALACRASYGKGDVTIIDWNAAMIFDRDTEDVRTVLEFANVELLEMRFLDRQLDGALDESYRVLSRRTGPRWLLGDYRRTLQRIGRMQVDGTVLFEGVNNALKLLGDQYLARVYRLASERLHVPDWDAGILRKLSSLESIYGKLSDDASIRRMELLEWIIIVLIAVSIALPFVTPHK
ncbi:hypothetical protein RAS1_11210 [Phycisphaerae bacterium RAS1]|nr:hypothetical protein RAS1_11210 [Phycisphaerae bacterium RAS1]